MTKLHLHFTLSDVKTIKRLMKKCKIESFSAQLILHADGSLFYTNTSVENFKDNYSALSGFDSTLKSLIEKKLSTVDRETYLNVSMSIGDKSVSISTF